MPARISSIRTSKRISLVFAALAVTGYLAAAALGDPTTDPAAEQPVEKAELPAESPVEKPGAADAPETPANVESPKPETAADSDAPSGDVGLEKAAGTRDLLEAYGIDQSHFDRLADGVPWQESEDELLARVMFRMRSFPLADLETWAKPWQPGETAAEPGALRGEVFRVSGSVQRVTEGAPVPEVRERFELTKYYRCEFLLGEDRQPAVVFAEKIPQSWEMGKPLDQRAGALGLFLKFSGSDVKQPTPVFVAPRVAWYPSTVLGDLGMDYGLFDDLRGEEPAEEDHSPGIQMPQPKRDISSLRLTSRSREGFYQMLAAVGRAKPGELRRQAREKLEKSGAKTSSVIPLFNEPQKVQGELVLLTGKVRQAIPVRVSEEDIVGRFAVQQYYQMFLFTDDSQGNPLVVITPSLPKGMPTGEDPSYAEAVTVAGFFFNTWAYRSRQSGQSSDKIRWQLAPLLIGQQPVWHPRPKPSSNVFAAVVFGVLFVVAICGIWIALWLSGRGDRDFRKKFLAGQTIPEGDFGPDAFPPQHAGPPDRGKGSSGGSAG